MVSQTDRQLLIRWMFRALAFLLFVGGRFTVHSVLYADFWGGLLFAKDSYSYLQFLGGIYIYKDVAGLLCLVTAYGLRRNKWWSSFVGLCTSGILLVGFPWLTVVGIIGFYVLLRPAPHSAPVPDRAPTAPTTDYWAAKRKSKAQAAVLTLFGIATWPLLGWCALYAYRAGMPRWHTGIIFWAWYAVFALFNTTLHESGHAIVAWAAGFQLRVISIGPFTFVRDRTRFRFRFDLSRLFETGGYMGAVPVSEQNLRMYQIAVIAAGPLTNAITCLFCLVIFLSLPGTALQEWWWIAAFNAVLAGVLAVSNLIPFGYCDGTMLLHLILWTPAGRLLAERDLVVRKDQEADTCHGRADFEGEIRLKTAMLQRSLAYGKDNALMIAACHQALASAYINVDDWHAAEFQYRKCLAFQNELALNPMLAANAWSGLHHIAIRRHQAAEAETAYTTAVAIIEKRKAAADSPSGPAIPSAMLAQLHARKGAFDAALQEIDLALKSLPNDSNRISLHARLLRVKAVCHLNLHDTDAGLAAARESADLFRSPEIPPGRRNLSWENIADLGHQLWQAGQSELAVHLLREGVGNLESGGAASIAAIYRIKLAAMLRHLCRIEEARAALPQEQAVSGVARRAFLAERSQLHSLSGRPDLAVADCRELVKLWRAQPSALPTEIASAQALLAEALLAMDDVSEADTLAIQAADVLGPQQHSDAASCLITLAISRAQSDPQCSSSMIAEALHLIESDPLLASAEKQRLQEAARARSSAVTPSFA